MIGRALKLLPGLLLWCCATSADSIETIEPPRPAELEMLRGDIDPDHVIIGHVK